MNIILDEIEDFPIYIMRRGQDSRLFEKAVEVSEEQAARWERVLNEYERVQLEMKALYRGYNNVH
jgi:hypothetical protein